MLEIDQLLNKSYEKYTMSSLVLISSIRYVKLGCQIFYLILFSFFSLQFLYYGLKVRVRVTSQLCCHTSVTSEDIITVIVTKLQEYRESQKRFWKNNIIQCMKHILILRQTHSCLGQARKAVAQTMVVQYIRKTILYRAFYQAFYQALLY